MAYFAPKFSITPSPICTSAYKTSIPLRSSPFGARKPPDSHLLQAFNRGGDSGNGVREMERPPALKRVRASPNLSEEQKLAISQLPPKMTNRCKALMKQITCFSAENGSVPRMLAFWVRNTKPQRADWLAVLKELERLNHFLYFEVAEYAFTEESFEASIRDYTKIIHGYAKQDKLGEAERALEAMKNRGFMCDQVTLTALVHMYSKAGNLKLAEDTFEEMKLLGVPLDKRSYGSIVMAYIRAGKLTSAESSLREMEARQIYAPREVYKALLRAYSMLGDSQGAQRAFDAIQVAGIIPDAKVCGLLINAYVASGQTREARIAFENMRRSDLEPNDKCTALLLAAYEKENRLKEALDVLMELERDNVMLGKESSDLLVQWFRRLGVVEEVDRVLKDFASRMHEHIL
uniref:Pentatricopeptide repeat protein n=1 Tax=Salvia miltiorrhiza TaxID=226208 RepID=A0A678WE83_SALMI|nr:pentatricopeptide repeat protein [Salvia miltiorrhiza]